jgi:hypothetical protein
MFLLLEVIQRRKDGSTYCYRTWEDYKKGFGNPSEEFWIGKIIFSLLLEIANLDRSNITFYLIYVA